LIASGKEERRPRWELPSDFALSAQFLSRIAASYSGTGTLDGSSLAVRVGRERVAKIF